MVSIEYSTDDENNNGPYGDQYGQPGAGTQAAASALLGFGAASGEQQLTSEQQVFRQSKEKKQRYFNSLAGDITGMSDDEEEEMINFNEGWYKGAQQARQQVKSPMQIETTTATNPCRVTMSNQKKLLLLIRI